MDKGRGDYRLTFPTLEAQNPFLIVRIHLMLQEYVAASAFQTGL